MVIVPRADELPIVIEVAQAAVDRVYRRVGSDEAIPANGRVVFLVDTDRKRSLPKVVHDAIDGAWLSLPADLDADEELPAWIDILTDGRCTLGLASTIAMRKLKARLPLAGLAAVHAAIRDADRDPLELDDLGFPVLERFEDGDRLRTYRETADRTELVYLCRLMALARGQAEEAARQAGLTRQYIYQLLKSTTFNPATFESDQSFSSSGALRKSVDRQVPFR